MYVLTCIHTNQFGVISFDLTVRNFKNKSTECIDCHPLTRFWLPTDRMFDQITKTCLAIRSYEDLAVTQDAYRLLQLSTNSISNFMLSHAEAAIFASLSRRHFHSGYNSNWPTSVRHASFRVSREHHYTLEPHLNLINFYKPGYDVDWINWVQWTWPSGKSRKWVSPPSTPFITPYHRS